MFCPKCGNTVPNDAAFCPSCGGRLSSSSENKIQSSPSPEADQTRSLSTFPIPGKSTAPTFRTAMAALGVALFFAFVSYFEYADGKMMIVGVIPLPYWAFAILAACALLFGLYTLFTYKKATVLELHVSDVNNGKKVTCTFRNTKPGVIYSLALDGNWLADNVSDSYSFVVSNPGKHAVRLVENHTSTADTKEFTC